MGIDMGTNAIEEMLKNLVILEWISLCVECIKILKTQRFLMIYQELGVSDVSGGIGRFNDWGWGEFAKTSRMSVVDATGSTVNLNKAQSYHYLMCVNNSVM